eukprot:8260797-Prorocentrum_lima.AAC.1
MGSPTGSRPVTAAAAESHTLFRMSPSVGDLLPRGATRWGTWVAVLKARGAPGALSITSVRPSGRR